MFRPHKEGQMDILAFGDAMCHEKITASEGNDEKSCAKERAQ